MTIALVTGGTGAIGREICTGFLERGLVVVANCHPADLDAAHAWRETLAAGDRLRLAAFDVSDAGDSLRAVREIAEQVGHIAYLVNGAGITRDALLRKLDPQNWQAVLRVNLDSVYNVTRAVVDGMQEHGFGRIVSISSVNGQRGQLGQTNYSAAKAGMLGFTMALAREVARHGVTVNAVSPGYVDSPLVMAVPEKVRAKLLRRIPVRRFAAPAEIAHAVMFLCDERAGYITGANIPVNGGYHMSM